MGNKISIYLREEAVRAYEYLKRQPGGFNLSSLVRDILVKVAKQRGWKGDKK